MSLKGSLDINWAVSVEMIFRDREGSVRERKTTLVTANTKEILIEKLVEFLPEVRNGYDMECSPIMKVEEIEHVSIKSLKEHPIYVEAEKQRHRKQREYAQQEAQEERRKDYEQLNYLKHKLNLN
jgi:hypothetical protein